MVHVRVCVCAVVMYSCAYVCVSSRVVQVTFHSSVCVCILLKICATLVEAHVIAAARALLRMRGILFF